MEQEKIDLLIRAAKILQDKKELYDYMVVLLPIGTAVLGWLAAILWQSHIFTKNTKKEHYYNAREKVELIVESYSAFLDYVYNFYKQAKNTANQHSLIDSDDINDFITRYQFKLSSIHQKLKIIFPGRRFPTEKITNEMHKFEKNINDMNEMINEVQSGKYDLGAIQSRNQKLNDDNKTVIASITDQVNMIEDSIINILNNQAKEVGIKYI